MGGFTLVELVVVIVVSGVLSTLISKLIIGPVESFQAQSRRADQVDIADTALRRMSRDIRNALPNSVRIGCGGHCLEYLRTVTGGRYRAKPESNPFSLSFDPSDADTSFEVLGFLNNQGDITIGSAAGDCAAGTASCVVIYNTGLAGTNAYAMDNAATVTAVNAGARISIDFINSGFTADTAFPATSPDQHFFIIDTPVTYLCDPGQGSLRSYQGYSIHSSQDAVDSHGELTGLTNPAEHALLAEKITACQFSYSPGTPSRNGLVVMTLTIADQNEQIVLLQQAHVSNMP